MKQLTLVLTCLGLVSAGYIGQAQTCVSAPSGVTYWWSAEGSGQNVVAANKGTVSSGVTYATGKVNQAFKFNGTGANVNFGATAGNFRTNDFTVEYWMKDSVTRFEAFLEKRPACDMDVGSGWWGIRIGTNAGIELSGTNLQGYTNLSTTMALNDGSWHHVAFTREGTNIAVYVDGTLNNSVSSTEVADVNTTASLKLGTSSCINNDLTSYYSGYIDELTIYSRALSSTEIQDIYNADSAGKCLVAPIITTAPVNKTARLGTSVTYTVAALGSIPITYQWSKNGTPISGATTTSLSVSVAANVENVYPQDTYSVEVTNPGGTTNVSATLRVLPSIIVQPQTQVSVAGSSVTVCVDAVATASFNYQWRRNNGAISGATSSCYTIANGDNSNSGTYTVVVSNSDGSTTSSGAGVHFSPTITVAPVSQTIAAGNATWLNVTAIGTLPFTYQWKFNGSVISGKTTNTVSVSDEGTYTIVINNAYGSTSADAVITSDTNPACMILPTNAANLWRGETNADDSIGSSNGTATNIVYVTGHVGQAFQFDGSTTGVNFGTNAGNFGTNDFTIEYWVNTTNTSRGEGMLEKRPACNMDFGASWWGIRNGVDGKPVLEIAGASNTYYKTLTPTNSLADGLWHHVAWVRQARNLSVYVDGSFHKTATTSGIASINNTAPLNLGVSACDNVDYTFPFSGIADEVQIFDRALTATEIHDTWAAGGAGYCP